MTHQQLVLIRHAKSADGPIDIERPLAPRGRRDAGAIGQFLAERGTAPDLVAVSPARRARQTWDGVQAELSATVDIVINDRIYDNNVAALLEVIHDTPAGVHTVALVGHNPSFAELAAGLDDGEGDTDARQQLLLGFPTSAVAVFEVAGSWADVRPNSATLRVFAVPRAKA